MTVQPKHQADKNYDAIKAELEAVGVAPDEEESAIAEIVGDQKLLLLRSKVPLLRYFRKISRGPGAAPAAWVGSCMLVPLSQR